MLDCRTEAKASKGSTPPSVLALAKRQQAAPMPCLRKALGGMVLRRKTTFERQAMCFQTLNVMANEGLNWGKKACVTARAQCAP